MVLAEAIAPQKHCLCDVVVNTIFQRFLQVVVLLAFVGEQAVLPSLQVLGLHRIAVAHQDGRLEAGLCELVHGSVAADDVVGRAQQWQDVAVGREGAVADDDRAWLRPIAQ